MSARFMVRLGAVVARSEGFRFALRARL
jgi:hypothetical protein